MDIETLRTFFGWCTVINGGLLIFSFLICTLADNWVYRMHSKWFPISREAFNLTIYCFIGGIKILFFFLSFVPYLALLIIT